MKQQFLDLKGLEEVVAYIKNYVDDSQRVIPYASYTLFPTVGDQYVIYVDTSTNAIYRWDDTNIKYYPLAFDPNSEFTMLCGDSKKY